MDQLRDLVAHEVAAALLEIYQPFLNSMILYQACVFASLESSQL